MASGNMKVIVKLSELKKDVDNSKQRKKGRFQTVQSSIQPQTFILTGIDHNYKIGCIGV